MLTTVEILRAARTLIEDEARWTKGHDARDATGEDTDPRGDDAVCWCAGGAIVRFAPDDDDMAEAVIRGFADTLGVDLAFHFNDAPTTTHADVLAAFDKAIAAVEA